MNPASSQTHTAFLSIGSNIGDKLANCRGAIARLAQITATEVSATSAFYKTEPVDYLDQDWFVNAAVRVKTRLTPEALLQSIQQIQHQAGRKQDSIRFGPRILDIDIIFYDDRIIELADLIIPHPRAHKRRFVLQPICDIQPAFIHPVYKQTVQSILNRLEDGSQGIERFPCCE